jgi:hypothetical protein
MFCSKTHWYRARDCIQLPRNEEHWFWRSDSCEPNELVPSTQSAVVFWGVAQGCVMGATPHGAITVVKVSNLIHNCYLKGTYTFSKVCMEKTYPKIPGRKSRTGYSVHHHLGSTGQTTEENYPLSSPFSDPHYSIVQRHENCQNIFLEIPTNHSKCSCTNNSKGARVISEPTRIFTKNYSLYQTVRINFIGLVCHWFRFVQTTRSSRRILWKPIWHAGLQPDPCNYAGF